jgi:hypothetical protein
VEWLLRAMLAVMDQQQASVFHCGFHCLPGFTHISQEDLSFNRVSSVVYLVPPWNYQGICVRTGVFSTRAYRNVVQRRVDLRLD